MMKFIYEDEYDGNYVCLHEIKYTLLSLKLFLMLLSGCVELGRVS